jgi:hypothetical protein
MSDTTPPTAPAAEPAAVPTVAPAPDPTAPAAGPTADEIAAAILRQQATAAETPAAPAAPANPPVPANLFSKGAIVKLTTDDPYTGKEDTRYGIVVETFPDEGDGAQSAVAWFNGVSGPIGDQNLSGV